MKRSYTFMLHTELNLVTGIRNEPQYVFFLGEHLLKKSKIPIYRLVFFLLFDKIQLLSKR